MRLAVLGLLALAGSFAGAQPPAAPAADKPLPTAFHEALGRLYMDYARPALAMDAYRQGLLAVDDQTPQPAVESCFFGLMNAAEATGQRAKLGAMLVELAGKITAGPAKAMLLSRAAEALEMNGPGQETAARDVYRQALAAMGSAKPTEAAAIERRRDLLTRLARLESMTGANQEANAHFEEALALAPDFASRMPLRANLLQALQASGKLPDRLKELEARLAAKPDDTDALEAIAALYLGTPGFTAKGAEALTKLHALLPDDQAISEMLADTLTATDPKAAAKLYEELMAKGQDGRERFAVAAARLRAAAGEEAAALTLLGKCVPTNVPYDSPAGQRLLARLLESANMLPRAIEAYTKAGRGFVAGAERDACLYEAARLMAQAGRRNDALAALEALAKEAAQPATRERAEEPIKRVKELPAVG